MAEKIVKAKRMGHLTDRARKERRRGVEVLVERTADHPDGVHGVGFVAPAIGDTYTYWSTEPSKHPAVLVAFGGPDGPEVVGLLDD